MVLFCYRAPAVWGSGSSSLYTQLKELAVDGFRELTSVSDPDPLDPQLIALLDPEIRILIILSKILRNYRIKAQ
jgi:hypothetical protein